MSSTMANEIRYLISQCSYVTEEVYNVWEVSRYFDQNDTLYNYEVQPQKLTDPIVSFIKKNIKKNPLQIFYILNRFAESNLLLREDIEGTVKSVIIEELFGIFKEFNDDSSINNKYNIHNLMIILSEFTWVYGDFDETILSNIISKIVKVIIVGNEKIFYLSLLSHKTNQLLNSIAKYGKKSNPIISLPLNADTMIELCYGYNKHWLSELNIYFNSSLNNEDSDLSYSDPLYHRLCQLALINLMIKNNLETTEPILMIKKMESILSLVGLKESNQSFNVYYNEIIREKNLISFCTENSKKKMYFSWHSMFHNHSALSIISQTCDISQLDYFKLKQVLTANHNYLCKNKVSMPEEETYLWDVMTYNAYCLVTKVIDCILLDSQTMMENDEHIGSDIANIKKMITNLHPATFRIEILKIVFACVFIRFEYFKNNDERMNQTTTSHSDSSYFKIREENGYKKFNDCAGFICSAHLLNSFLLILKDAITNLKNQKISETDLDHLEEFENQIMNGIWKWNFINSLELENCNLFTTSVENIEKLFTRTEKKKKKLRKTTSISSDENLYLRRSTSDAKDSNINCIDTKPDFISLMLAKPHSLLNLCLEYNNFSDAHKLIEMYDLSDTEAYTEVTFTENLIHLKNEIVSKENAGNVFTKYTPVEMVTGSSVTSTTIMSMVESFLSTQRSPHNYQLANLAKIFPQLQIYDNSYAIIIILTDIIFSSGINHDITYGILNVAEKKFANITMKTDLNTKQLNYITFGKNMIDIFYNIHNKIEVNGCDDGICSILSDDKIPIIHKRFVQYNSNMNEIKQFHENVTNQENIIPNKSFDALIALLLKQRKLYLTPVIESLDYTCKKNIGDDNKYSFLKYFITYVENISKLLNIQEESGKTNKDILDIPLHLIIGDLIHKQNISLEKIEHMCKEFKINIIHKLVINYSMPINCCFKEIPTDGYYFEMICDERESDKNIAEKFNPMNITDYITPNPNIIAYILKHNWIISNLLKKVHCEISENALEQSTDRRTRCLDIFLQMKRFDELKILFSNNKTLTALQTNFNTATLYEYLQYLYSKKELLLCLDVIYALPENISSSNFFKCLKNKILVDLTEESHHNWKCLLSLFGEGPQFESVLEIVLKMNYEDASELLKYYSYQVEPEYNELKSNCSKWLERLEIYYKISLLNTNHTWNSIHSTSQEDPETILQLLLDDRQFDLCLQWSELHEISPNVKNLISQNLLKQYLQDPANIDLVSVNAIISRLPLSESIMLCKEMILKVKDVQILRTMHSFLSMNTHESQYENLQIGIELLSNIEINERHLFWDLIDKPLLILEQYLMNAKLETLETLLKKIKPFLKIDPLGDNLYYNISLINSATISINSIDSLLRIYAAKSLDLRSAKSSKLSISDQTSENLLLSIDSINLVGNSVVFTMPEEVPSKDQWVADNFSNNCMVCKTTIFSILIRRHHCRRCGRLVCYSCSRHRIQIPGYFSDIKVRVCDECHVQIFVKSNVEGHNAYALTYGSISNYSDSLSMEWCLTSDPKHNNELRKDFVYEYSPDVNLCLTIMNMHSANLSYPRFLLDRCTELSRAAGKATDGVLELVSMRKALLVSCAVLYAQPLLMTTTSITDTALAHTEYQLAVTDALTRLATQGCHTMMPNKDSIDTHYVSQLLKAEKWELALEISTKFGFSIIGVLATWGKACLKSGCFDLARQKFALCFKTNIPHNTSQPSSNIEDLTDKNAPISFNKNESQYEINKGKAYPALLNEILSILETNNYCLNAQILKKSENIKNQYEKFSSIHKPGTKSVTTEMPLNVMHTLSSLNKIKEGDFSDFSTYPLYKKKPKQNILKKQTQPAEKLEYKRKLESFFYNECIYYLTTYGTHKSLINFYLKYGNLTEAIQHCHKHSVDKETFTNYIFMLFLKTNKLNEVLKVMHDMDNSWIMWTDYLMYACRLLEHKGWLEALHAVQIGIGDYGRAAITCAGLYTRPTQAPHAAVLHERVHYLTQARGHLQHVPRKIFNENTLPSSKSLHLSIDGNALEKHINTICKQIEISAFLYSCENSGKLTENMVKEISISPATSANLDDNECFLPTLFGTYNKKLKLAVILLACGSDLLEGFSYVIKLIKIYNLDPHKIFNSAVLYFVNNERYDDIQSLCDYIKKYCEENANMIIDSMIEIGIAAIVRRCDKKGQLFDELAELLIMKTDNVSVKISCYIECRLLKTACMLAIQHNRLADLRKIMSEAERLGQTSVKNACMKRLSR